MSGSRLTHSGNLLLAGFGLMIAMMSVMVYLSMKQDIHMVSKDYYEQELVYQQKLNAMAKTDAYDNQFSISGNNGLITLHVPKELSRGLSSGSVYFYCPASEKMDRREKLDVTEEGIYSFSRASLPGKSYIAKISLNVDNVAYYKELKLN